MRASASILLLLLLLLPSTASALDAETFDRLGALGEWSIGAVFDYYDATLGATEPSARPLGVAADLQYARVWRSVGPEGERLIAVARCPAEEADPLGPSTLSCVEERALGGPTPTVGPLVDIALLGPGEIASALASSAAAAPPALLHYGAVLPAMLLRDTSHVEGELVAILP